MARERVTIAVRADDPEVRAAIVARARRRGFHRFHDTPDAPVPAAVGMEVVRREGDRLFVTEGGARTIPIVRVAEPAELDAAGRAVADGGILAIEWSGDRVIPLENAIARKKGRFALWVYARRPSEVPAALGALEHGADRVFVEVRTPEEIDVLESLVEGPLPASLEWTDARLTFVRPTGVGDRVLVDTTSLLQPGEGLLVGSAAAFLFLVVSEAVGSRFSRPRPFRVNAGAAHSYVLLADGTTRYLSELEPGDPVLVAGPSGSVRSARVGRIKIERRPLVVAGADDHGRPRTVFLQEAETVRLVTPDGPVPTAALAAGTTVRAVRAPAARHLGHAVEETIEER